MNPNCTCAHCGASFYRRPKAQTATMTCSRHCLWQLREAKRQRPSKVTLNCQHCGKEFQRYSRYLNKYKTACCSQSCSAKLQGVAHMHTPEARRRALEAQDRSMSGNPNWAGGRHIKNGYVMVRMPDHPRARANGYVAEHLLVAEQMLGRALLPAERVRHMNHDKADNRPENLEVRVYRTGAL